jgi:hypothetical protein
VCVCVCVCGLLISIKEKNKGGRTQGKGVNISCRVGKEWLTEKWHLTRLTWSEEEPCRFWGKMCQRGNSRCQHRDSGSSGPVWFRAQWQPMWLSPSHQGAGDEVRGVSVNVSVGLHGFLRVKWEPVRGW